MNEQNDETMPLSADPPPAAPPAAAPAQPRARRTLGLPVVIAIASGTLLIGGLVGGIIGYAVHSDGHDGGRPSFGPGQRMQQDGQFQRPGGQAPGGQAPGDQTPDDSGTDDSSS